MRSRHYLAGACLALLVVASSVACTGGHGASSHDPSPDAQLAFTVTSETPLAVESRDYEVVSTLPYEVNGEVSSYIGTAKDGTQVWVTHGVTRDADAPEDPRGMALVTRDPKTGEAKEVARHGTPDHWVQLPGVTITGNHVVWVETPSTSLYEEPWELYTYNVATGREKHLASSDFFGIDRPPQPWLQGIVPIIEGQFVYLPAVDEVRKSDPAGFGRASVYRVPLKGGDPELVAKGAIEVFSDRGGMLQMRFPDRLVQWDPSKGTEGEVAGTSLPASYGSFANEGVRVAFDDDAGVRIQKPDGSKVEIEVEIGKAGDVEDQPAVYYPNATSRWVSFTVDADASQKGYLFDLERNRLMRLKLVENSSSSRLSGNLYDLRIRWYRNQPPESFPLIRLLP